LKRTLASYKVFGRPIRSLLVMTDDEMRSEARVRSRGQVTILAAGGEQIPGTIYDVSASGLCLDLETQSELSPGTSVAIDSQGFAAEGVVRNGERLGPIYRIGVELKPAEPA
jgi:hypothetical protein